MKGTKHAAFYLRVSTSEQDTKRQHRELQAVAQHRGWTVTVYEDAGISGAKGRDKRPAFDAMLRDVTRGKVDVVAAWALDRLGRNLRGLLDTLGEIQGAGCDLYLHQQGIDTSTPAGRAMYAMLGTFAEFERDMIRERIVSGLARAKAEGKAIGRPRLDPAKVARIRELRAQHVGIRKVARMVGCGVSAVQRVEAEPLPA